MSLQSEAARFALAAKEIYVERWPYFRSVLRSKVQGPSLALRELDLGQDSRESYQIRMSHSDKTFMSRMLCWCLNIYFLVCSLLFCSSVSLAQERYEFYNGVRALGMGGAMVGVVNDETALISNPAGLGRLRDYFITVADPEIEGNSNVERVAGTDVAEMFNPQDALDKLRTKPGVRYHQKVQVFPSVVVPNFGVGLHGKYVVDAEVNEAGTAYLYNYTNDFAGVMGFNFRIWDGIIKFGANVRLINRVEVREADLAPSSTNLKLRNLATEGVGVGSDVGLILTAPIQFLPSIAAVWRDVGHTSYNIQNGYVFDKEERPQLTKQSVDVALSLFPIHGKGWRSAWTVEYRDVLTADEEDAHARRLHAGVEFNFADAIFIRGGMNQRYWTAGFEVASFHYQVQAATYGEDIGTVQEPREDRRYVLKVSIRF